MERVSFNGDTFGFVSSRDVTWYTKVWAIICQSLIFIVWVFFFQESPLVQVHHHQVQDLNFPWEQGPQQNQNKVNAWFNVLFIYLFYFILKNLSLCFLCDYDEEGRKLKQ